MEERGKFREGKVNEQPDTEKKRKRRERKKRREEEEEEEPDREGDRWRRWEGKESVSQA